MLPLAAEGETRALRVILAPVVVPVADDVRAVVEVVVPLEVVLFLLPQPIIAATELMASMRTTARRSNGGSQSCGPSSFSRSATNFRK